MPDQKVKPDLILRNGRVATLDKASSFTQAIAVQDSRFVAAGSNEEIMRLRSANTQVIDLGSRTVIPGLNDSHMHPIRGGLNYNMELRWDGVPSLADALRIGSQLGTLLTSWTNCPASLGHREGQHEF